MPDLRFPAVLAIALGVSVAVFSGVALSADRGALPYAAPLLWPEPQRAFVQDGPGLLLGKGQLAELANLDTVGRGQWIEGFLAADPDPSTPDNELTAAIDARRALVESELPTWLDDRARLLFLHGPPAKRQVVACAEVYQPLELWTYRSGATEQSLVLYQPRASELHKLWRPVDSKRVLYNPEMEYWLEQWEELRSRITGGRRFDREVCDEAKAIDLATGVDGLYGFYDERPKNADIGAFLEPPADLAAWALAAAGTPAPEPGLSGGELKLYFPSKARQRMAANMLLTLPPDAGVEPFVEEDRRSLRLVMSGLLEREGKVFETFRVRFQLPVAGDGETTEGQAAEASDAESDATGSGLATAAEDAPPIVLLAERRLRPGQEFLLRLEVTDEVSGRTFRLARGFTVPEITTPLDQQPRIPEEALLAMGENLKKDRIGGYDSLVLVPPESDVVFGLWRAEALVTGDRIEKVVFYLDDQKVMSRRRPPFTAELRLETYPTEQMVRAEGFDAAGQIVSKDEVVVNQPRGELRVRILEPARGFSGSGEVKTRAEVVVPEERRVAKVEFLVGEESRVTLDKPPWETVLDLPPNTGDLSYLTVVAELDDGARAEDVRFLASPDQIEEVNVDLVELYTTVSDGSGRLVRGLEASDFSVREDGRPQKIVKFELVEDLPLTLGLVVDTSGSMFESLGEARNAAIGFLDNIITLRDRCFALGFADRPYLLMQRTSDVGAVAEQLEDLVADGATALHDAVVSSLYYYRGIRGRRALVLLSDGEDTASSLEFKEALEYARRSGVSIYSIGLGIGRADVGVRRKLEALADETGGRTFYIREAAELETVYGEIEAELRSQYLVAYGSDRPGGDGTYREVEVDVKGSGRKARTIRGYYS
ncbi:MAG: VWA domain-containing protein [Acidobacteriota bacterium]